MRTNCPICKREAIDHFEMEYAIPDDWTLPRRYDWKLCKCGMIWADTPATAADFDNFYRNNYAPHIDEHDIARMRNIASYIFSNFLPDTRIIDYGGGDEYLARYLKDYGFTNVRTVNLDDKMTNCEVVILSQVIEHLYDLDGNMDKIDSHLVGGGVIIIETPDAASYSLRKQPPMLDYYPTHVNHFSIQTLQVFMALRGYYMAANTIYEYRATNAPMMRAVFIKGEQRNIFDRVKTQIEGIEKLDIDEPVIVYGLGDLSLYQILHSGLNVKCFIDDSPIYKGTAINGIPVTNKIDCDYPIVIFGQRHKDEIIGKLKGLKNKVIVI